MTAEALAEYVRRKVAAAPPVDDETRGRLRTLLRAPNTSRACEEAASPGRPVATAQPASRQEVEVLG